MKKKFFYLLGCWVTKVNISKIIFSLDLKIFVPHEYVSHVVHNATISNNIVFKCKFYHFSPTKAKPKLDNFAEKNFTWRLKIERFYIIFVLVADGIPNTKSEPGVY